MEINQRIVAFCDVIQTRLQEPFIAAGPDTPAEHTPDSHNCQCIEQPTVCTQLQTLCGFLYIFLGRTDF